MVDVCAQTDRRDGVTLVTATVTAEGGPTSVRLEPAVDGPVWPPRRQGEPEAGWTDGAFEGTVSNDGRLAVGFATPATPADPPVRVVDAQPATADDEDLDSPSAVLRGLGDPSPPSLAVPADADAEAERPPASPTDDSDESTTDLADDGTPEATVGEPVPDRDDPNDDPELPPTVAEWLSAVAARVDRAEALGPGADVDAAADAIEACGSLDAALALEGSLGDDVERLRTIEARAGALADRAEAADLATTALERLR